MPGGGLRVRRLLQRHDFNPQFRHQRLYPAALGGLCACVCVSECVCVCVRVCVCVSE